jgi:hypothetical protein
MTPEKRNSGARETTVAREWLSEHIISKTAVTSLNNRRPAVAMLSCGPAPSLLAVAKQPVGQRRTGKA